MPQVYANDVRSGQEVAIALEEFPGQRFAGSVERVSGGLDATTRARQVEITVPKELEVLEGITREAAIVANPSDQLRAGEVVRVQPAMRMAEQPS